MADGKVIYVYPAWGLVPPVKHKAHGIHVTVVFEDGSGAAPDIVHNLDLPFAGELQPPEWVYPWVLVNVVAGGPQAPQHILTVKDGNTVSVQRAASGPGTAVTYDVWVLRPVLKSGWFD
jgi:hypothetical protein